MAMQYSRGFLHRLQSVLKAAARLTHRSSLYGHIHTNALRPLLAVSRECINFKLAVLITYMVWRHCIQRINDANHHCLRSSSSSSQLVIQQTRLSTVSHHVFLMVVSSVTRKSFDILALYKSDYYYYYYYY